MTAAPEEGEAPVTTTYDAFVEPMLRGQLSGCKGIEVHKRGDGFMAGTVGGPIVLIEASVMCTEVPDGGDTKAIVRSSWSSRRAGDNEFLGSFEQTADPVRRRCPKEIGALVRQALTKPPPDVCTRAFQVNWEDFGLATFFVPVLEPAYVTRLSERDNRPTLLFEHRGRTLELSGDVRCVDLSDSKSEKLLNGMRPLELHAQLRLIDTDTRQQFATWNERFLYTLAISCDVAFRKPLKPEKLEASRAEWATRINRAISAP